MTKHIKSITEKDVKNFREDYVKLMTELENKYGLKLDIGTIRYNENELRFKTTLKSVGEQTEKQFKSTHKEFDEWAIRRGYTKLVGKLGNKYTVKNNNYQVVGHNPRASVNCLIIKSLDGRTKGKEYSAPIGYLNI